MIYKKWPFYDNRMGELVKGYKTPNLIGDLTLNPGQTHYAGDILYNITFSIDGSQARYVIAENSNGNSAIELFNTADNEYTMVIRSNINVYQTIEHIPCMPGKDIDISIWLNRRFGYEDQVIVEVTVDGGLWEYECIRSGSFANRWDYFFDRYYFGQSGIAFSEVIVEDHVFKLNTMGSDMVLYNTNSVSGVDKYHIKLEGDPFDPNKVLG